MMGKRYVAQLFQGGMKVAEVDAVTRKDAEREINHYAFVYGQDGEVEIKRNY